MPFPRASGVLLHPTSLPGPHGVGDLGRAAYRFVDRLAEADQSLWQILPLGPTGEDNSPYQCLSSFAGNPLLINLELLAEEGLLDAADLEAEASADEAEAVYAEAEAFKTPRLRRAYDAFSRGGGGTAFREGYDTFRTAEAGWLEDYALFAALKTRHGGKAWPDWPAADARAARSPEARARARRENAEEVEYRLFLQYLFARQWRALRAYANERGVRLMGDVPIYVAHDSADVWAHPEGFALDETGRPTAVAGVPPDYFSPTGQLWGNPIYRWDRLREDGYAWWIRRIEGALGQTDLLRIDHFRAFEAYWEVPAGEATAVYGRWIKGPAEDFLAALRDALGDDLPIVAEDLGTITAGVHALRNAFGIPGMRVLQFGFNPGAEIYLPHTWEKNCVAYVATHDNDTTRGWYAAEGPDYAHMDPGALRAERCKARRYLGRDGGDIAWDMMRAVLASVADTAVLLAQDLLDLGNAARMNRPGTPKGQWRWRMTPEQLATFPAERLRALTRLYDRAPDQDLTDRLP